MEVLACRNDIVFKKFSHLLVNSQPKVQLSHDNQHIFGCMCVCILIYIYIYTLANTHTFTHTHTVFIL
jgi:hypothetical protein